MSELIFISCFVWLIYETTHVWNEPGHGWLEKGRLAILAFTVISGAIVAAKHLLNPEARRARREKAQKQKEEQALSREEYLRNQHLTGLANAKNVRELALPPATPKEQFGTELLRKYNASCNPRLVENYLNQIIEIFASLYNPQTKQQAHDYMQACLTGLVNFTKLIPSECHEPAKAKSLFSVHRDLSDLVTRKTGKVIEIRDEYYPAYYALAAPFKTSEQEEALSFLDWTNTYPAAYLAERNRYDDMPMKEYEKLREKALAEQDKYYPYATPFNVTALYVHSDKFLPTGSITTPFDIPEDVRFRHQWVIGDSGAGKTTFLSAMISDDLMKVARNEASIFIMDSQNELIPDIAGMKMFAPGQPLHGRLIYLEPDPDYPLALNIFDTNKSRLGALSTRDRAMMESGAVWMVEFFLSSLVKSEASPHQDTFLNYVISGLMAIPDATIFTFKELLEPAPKNGQPPGYEKYKRHFAQLRPDTQAWLRDRMHSPELSSTRSAIRARLDGFTARGFFHDMFVHPRNKLDLFEELQSGKVILVNTMEGLLKNGTEPFGRYFIARLLQAAEERMFLKRGNRLPVYVYIDEAADYISEEESVEELLSKARKQNVALIFANQRESQIKSLTVRDALGRAAIQCRGQAAGGGETPLWQISIGNSEPVNISVPNINFADAPKMTQREYDAMLLDMRRRFSSQPPAEEKPRYGGALGGGGPQQQAPPKQEPPKQERPDPRSGPPRDHEYDDRYDILEQVVLNPSKARNGTILTVRCPNGRQHQQNIPAGTHSGYRFVVPGASGIRRPDNRNGNYWVELEIPQTRGKEDF